MFGVGGLRKTGDSRGYKKHLTQNSRLCVFHEHFLFLITLVRMHQCDISFYRTRLRILREKAY